MSEERRRLLIGNSFHYDRIDIIVNISLVADLFTEFFPLTPRIGDDVLVPLKLIITRSPLSTRVAHKSVGALFDEESHALESTHGIDIRTLFRCGMPLVRRRLQDEICEVTEPVLLIIPDRRNAANPLIGKILTTLSETIPALRVNSQCFPYSLTLLGHLNLLCKTSKTLCVLARTFASQVPHQGAVLG